MAKGDPGEGAGVGGGGSGGGGAAEQATTAPPSRGRVQAALSASERAEEAETLIKTLNAKIVSLEENLATAQAAFGQLEMRHRLERELEAAGAVDLETAVLLAELSLSSTDAATPDSAVTELRASKPFLFKHAGHGSATSPWPSPGAISAAMAAHATTNNDALASAAEEAAATGDRGALLRYLQLRRQQA